MAVADSMSVCLRKCISFTFDGSGILSWGMFVCFPVNSIDISVYSFTPVKSAEILILVPLYFLNVYLFQKHSMIQGLKRGQSMMRRETDPRRF